jgi:hypothetical protein
MSQNNETKEQEKLDRKEPQTTSTTGTAVPTTGHTVDYVESNGKST